MLTYCSTYRASMMAGGKKCLHLLSLIWGCNEKDCPVPSVHGALASRIKRWKSKRELIRAEKYDA